jgi:hypothetical protein
MTQPNIPAKVRPAKGRPKAARVKDHWISFRVTAEEHFQLIDKAQRLVTPPAPCSTNFASKASTSIRLLTTAIATSFRRHLK